MGDFDVFLNNANDTKSRGALHHCPYYPYTDKCLEMFCIVKMLYSYFSNKL